MNSVAMQIRSGTPRALTLGVKFIIIIIVIIITTTKNIIIIEIFLIQIIFYVIYVLSDLFI
jgi:hypothetical protein